MKLHHPFAALVVVIPPRLLAAEPDAPDCSAPVTQAAMKRCAWKEFLVANSAQAAALKRLAGGRVVG